MKEAVDKVQYDKMTAEVKKYKTIRATKGTAAAVFCLMVGILGSSKSPSDPVVINDPVSGIPIMSPDKIKSISLNYCVNLLTNREPSEGYADIIREKERLHSLRMKEVISDDIELLTPEMFNAAIKYIASKHSDKYNFILKGGSALMEALYAIFFFVWKTEQIPKVWHESQLVQLWKGKGNICDLQANRFIHTKSEVSKLFGQIVISEAKSNIFNNMSKYQIATKPGHRASEHLFTVKSVIGMMQMKKKAVIVSMWDLKSFFDTENLIDCMSELYKRKTKGKLYRLIFKMNENIRVSVKTPVGESDQRDTGMNVGQGTVDGAIISANNLDGGVSEVFDEEKDDNETSEETDSGEENVIKFSDFFHPVLF